VERYLFSKSEETFDCPCYFAHVINEHDFESTWLWDFKTRWNSRLCFDCICWFIVPVATDSSVLIRSNIVLSQWKRSIRVCRNQRMTNYVHVIDVNTVYLIHKGKSGEILELVARCLFTLTINEYTITNVCLNLSVLLKIIYIMIKYTFKINV